MAFSNDSGAFHALRFSSSRTANTLDAARKKAALQAANKRIGFRRAEISALQAIAADFQFFSGEMATSKPIVGKQPYIEIISRFSLLVQGVDVKQMMVQGDHACVICNYCYVFPNQRTANGEVEEIWTAKDAHLASLSTYFHTLFFKEQSSQWRLMKTLLRMYAAN
jgi:hypothetical protein